MHDFGQFPDNPLESPLDNSFLEDPLEFLPNALGPDAAGNFSSFDPLAAMNLQDLREEEDYFHMDSLGKLFTDAEAAIENTPAIPPTSPIDHLENSIQNTSIPPEAEVKEVQLFKDPGWGYSSPPIGSDNTTPPPLGIYGEPSTRSAFSADLGPITQHGGRIRNKYSGEDKIWCPLEDDFISPQTCQDQACEHYDPETRGCMHYDSEDSSLDTPDRETNDSGYVTKEDFEF